MRRLPLRHQPADGFAPGRETTVGWRDSRALLALQAGLLLAMAAAVVTRSWSDYPWLGWSLIAAPAAVWSVELGQARDRRWWFVYVFGIFLYTILRSYADETGIPIRTGYVLRFDRWLPGPEPVGWLQARWFNPADLDWLDYAAVATHWSFFVAPHLAAVLIFIFRRSLFPRYAALVVGIMWVGLLLFYLVPTTPPWLAAQEGVLPGVSRVMDFVGGRVNGQTYTQFYASLAEPNSVAAMPSIHMAVTFALFLFAASYAPRWLAALLLLYSALMSFALIYLGEHYAADEAVGMAAAFLTWLAIRRWWPAPPRAKPQRW